MKKTEIAALRRSIKFHEFAILQCARVISHIRKHGPAISFDRGAFYISPYNSRVRDPVAIVCLNWDIQVGAAIDSENEDIAKLRKQATRQYFPNTTDFEYRMFADLLLKLQIAHDDAFNIWSKEEIPAAMEEFRFQVQEISDHHQHLHDVAAHCLVTY